MGNKEDPGNDRPASFISIPGQVTEQLILEIISKHKKNLFRSSQNGFTKVKSLMMDVAYNSF